MDDPQGPIRVVLFDWGDTVMVNLPFPGPMAHWPRVDAVPGVAEALGALSPRYRLGLATNAAESGEALVRQALERVGLADCFEAVFTARELDRHKPEPAFFEAALERLGCAPGEAVMVGDGYRGDVIGAKEAGLRAIWFNPAGRPCPLIQPVHDAELHAMADLPARLEQPFPPDLAQCREWMEEQGLDADVLWHSEVVAAVAYHLASLLEEAGEEVEPLWVHRGALLHDLDKITTLEQRAQHGKEGARMLQQKGVPRLAQMVYVHPIYTPLEPGVQLDNWEEKLVFFADKLVQHDRLVDVRERLAWLGRRYPEGSELRRRALALTLEVQAELCRRIGLAPEELVPALRAWWERVGPPAS